MQIVEDKLEQITLQPEINKMDTSPESNDETVAISAQTESLNNTFVLKQNLNTAHAKRPTTMTPHRNKPPIDTRCLTKSITKPMIQRKKVVNNNNKPGFASRKLNQENMPLIMAATRTLADPILTKAITKSRVNVNNILTTKSSKLNLYKI